MKASCGALAGTGDAGPRGGRQWRQVRNLTPGGSPGQQQANAQSPARTDLTSISGSPRCDQ